MDMLDIDEFYVKHNPNFCTEENANTINQWTEKLFEEDGFLGNYTNSSIGKTSERLIELTKSNLFHTTVDSALYADNPNVKVHKVLQNELKKYKEIGHGHWHESFSDMIEMLKTKNYKGSIYEMGNELCYGKDCKNDNILMEKRDIHEKLHSQCMTESGLAMMVLRSADIPSRMRTGMLKMSIEDIEKNLETTRYYHHHILEYFDGNEWVQKDITDNQRQVGVIYERKGKLLKTIDVEILKSHEIIDDVSRRHQYNTNEYLNIYRSGSGRHKGYSPICEMITDDVLCLSNSPNMFPWVYNSKFSKYDFKSHDFDLVGADCLDEQIHAFYNFLKYAEKVKPGSKQDKISLVLSELDEKSNLVDIVKII